jgi:methylmalonyl-CoA mutase cobalamin-binding subunit
MSNLTFTFTEAEAHVVLRALQSAAAASNQREHRYVRIGLHDFAASEHKEQAELHDLHARLGFALHNPPAQPTPPPDRHDTAATAVALMADIVRHSGFSEFYDATFDTWQEFVYEVVDLGAQLDAEVQRRGHKWAEDYDWYLVVEQLADSYVRSNEGDEWHTPTEIHKALDANRQSAPSGRKRITITVDYEEEEVRRQREWDGTPDAEKPGLFADLLHGAVVNELDDFGFKSVVNTRIEND